MLHNENRSSARSSIFRASDHWSMRARLATRVAVCICGRLRTFLEEHVQHGFAHKLHRAGYEYFLASDTSVADPSLLQISLRNQSVSGIPFSRRPTRCPAANMTNRHTNHNQKIMAIRLRSCYLMLQYAEAQDMQEYHYVLRLRPDLLFLRPFPSVVSLIERMSRGRDLLLWDDIIAIAPREHAQAIYLVPRVAYDSCASVDAWNYACNGSFFSSKMRTPWETKTLDIENATWDTVSRLMRCPPCTPCTTMALIAWFASPKLRWSSFFPDPCSIEIERLSSAGRVMVNDISPSKFALEQERREQFHCMDLYCKARSMPGNCSLSTYRSRYPERRIR